MPLDTIAQIDNIRGDIPRSKWIFRALESLVAEILESKKPQVSVGLSPQMTPEALVFDETIPTRGTAE